MDVGLWWGAYVLHSMQCILAKVLIDGGVGNILTFATIDMFDLFSCDLEVRTE